MSMAGLAVAIAVAARLLMAHPGAILSIPQREPRQWEFDPPSVSISADGRWVALASRAQLVPADRNASRDVYVLDRSSGVITLESRIAGDARGTDSNHPRISADGRFLVYQAVVPDGDVASPGIAVVLRDRRLATHRFIHVGPASGGGRQPVISQDGRYIAFASTATDVVGSADRNGAADDVFVAETGTGRIRRVSVDDTGSQLAGAAVSPSISADGRYVAFVSTGSDPSQGAGSAGRRLSRIYVHDVTRSVTRRLSHRANGASWSPSIDGSGRFVAFVSAATNLVKGDRNRMADVFVVDLHAPGVELVSRSAKGRSANGPSGNPALSGDGRFVVFQSEASDLLCATRCDRRTEDINLLWDVFVFDRQARAITRLSADDSAGWMESSVGPGIDGSGGVIAFSSRHPVDESDTADDFDLFVVPLRQDSPRVGLRWPRASTAKHRVARSRHRQYVVR